VDFEELEAGGDRESEVFDLLFLPKIRLSRSCSAFSDKFVKCFDVFFVEGVRTRTGLSANTP